MLLKLLKQISLLELCLDELLLQAKIASIVVEQMGELLNLLEVRLEHVFVALFVIARPPPQLLVFDLVLLRLLLLPPELVSLEHEEIYNRDAKYPARFRVDIGTDSILFDQAEPGQLWLLLLLDLRRRI